MRIGLDTGGGTAERTAAVGADDERRRNDVAVAERDRHVVTIDVDRLRRLVDPAQHELRRAGIERRDEMTVFDVPAERFKADLARLEAHLRRAPDPPRAVDD